MPGTGSVKRSELEASVPLELKGGGGDKHSAGVHRVGFCVKSTVLSTSWLPWVSILDLRVVLILISLS